VVHDIFGLKNGHHQLGSHGDKFYCTFAQRSGYDTIVLFGGVNQLIYCNGGCLHTKFDTTCPPLELRTGYRASEECHCNDTFLDLNCHNNQVMDSQRGGDDAAVLSHHHHRLSPNAIANEKCIVDFSIGGMHDSYNGSSRTDFNLTLVFATHFLSSRAAFDQTYDSMIMIQNQSDNRVLVLNLEAWDEGGIDFFGHGNSSTATVKQLIGAGSSTTLLGYRDILSEKNSNRKAQPADLPKGRQYHLYTNLFGFSNPALVEVDGVKVGVIVFDAALIDSGVLTWHELIHWIAKESKCLRRLQASLVVLMGNDNYQHDRHFYRSVHNHVDMTLIASDDPHRRKHSCEALWYGPDTERVVRIPRPRLNIGHHTSGSSGSKHGLHNDEGPGSIGVVRFYSSAQHISITSSIVV